MSNWEDELMIQPEPEETTPIYAALYLEYREKFWARIGAVPVQEEHNSAEALKRCTGATSVTVTHERRNADGTLETISKEESN